MSLSITSNPFTSEENEILTQLLNNIISGENDPSVLITLFKTFNILEQNLAAPTGRFINGLSFADLLLEFKITDTTGKEHKFGDVVDLAFEFYRSGRYSPEEIDARRNTFYKGEEPIDNNPTLPMIINFYKTNTAFTINHPKKGLVTFDNLSFELDQIVRFNSLISRINEESIKLEQNSRLSRVFKPFIDSFEPNTIAGIQENSQSIFVSFMYNGIDDTLLNHIRAKTGQGYCILWGVDTASSYTNDTAFGGAMMLVPTLENPELEDGKYYIILHDEIDDSLLCHKDNIIYIQPSDELNQKIYVRMPLKRGAIMSSDLTKYTKGRVTIYFETIINGCNTLLVSGHFESDSNEGPNNCIKKLHYDQVYHQYQLYQNKYSNGKIVLFGDLNSNPKEITKESAGNFVRTIDGNLVSYHYDNTADNIIPIDFEEHFIISEKNITTIENGRHKVIDHIIVDKTDSNQIYIPINTVIDPFPIENTGTDHRCVSSLIIHFDNSTVDVDKFREFMNFVTVNA